MNICLEHSVLQRNWLRLQMTAPIDVLYCDAGGFCYHHVFWHVAPCRWMRGSGCFIDHSAAFFSVVFQGPHLLPFFLFLFSFWISNASYFTALNLFSYIQFILLVLQLLISFFCTWTSLPNLPCHTLSSPATFIQNLQSSVAPWRSRHCDISKRLERLSHGVTSQKPYLSSSITSYRFFFTVLRSMVWSRTLLNSWSLCTHVAVCFPGSPGHDSGLWMRRQAQ